VDVSTERARLYDRLKDLGVLWQEVRQEWNDPVRREFEETHWAALEDHVRAALRAMDRMAVVLSHARQDCS
jgi:hypothetical protein